MTIEKPTPWVGASGIEYLFEVFGLTVDVPHRLGNYIYAKKNDDGTWAPLYMGAGDLSTCCQDPALLQSIQAKQPTHVHMRLLTRAEDRREELHDLLAKHTVVFAPEGCQPEGDRRPPAPVAEAAPAPA